MPGISITSKRPDEGIPNLVVLKQATIMSEHFFFFIKKKHLREEKWSRKGKIEVLALAAGQ